MDPVRFPFRGAANHTPLKRTPSDFAPVARLRNARLNTPPGDRPQIGSRAAFKRTFRRQFGATAIQGLCTVGRAAVVTAYAVPPPDPGSGYDPCQRMTSGASIESGTLTGNSWYLDNVPSMSRPDLFDATGAGAAGAASCVDVALSPDGLRYAAAYNYTVGGRLRARVRIYTLATGAVAGELTISDASADRFVNRICFGSGLLFVCSNANVLVLNATTAALLATNTCNGWSSETIQAAVYNDGSAEWLFVGFNGATRGAIEINPAGTFTIDPGAPAAMWRAGVMKFRISAAAPYLTQVQFGDQLPLDDTWLESYGHNYWRVSERTSFRPYGCYITALAVGPLGQVVIARTNQGYGPNASYPPDGRANPGITLAMIGADGGLLWEADNGSIVEAGLDGYFNDIPIPGETGITSEPSLQAVAIDAAGDVYAGGRLNGAGYSAFKFRGVDGELLWGRKLSSSSTTLRTVAVDPSDSCPVFGGDENTAWTGAAGRAAHLWKVDLGSSEVVDHYALTAAVSCLGVAINEAGERVYGSDKL